MVALRFANDLRNYYSIGVFVVSIYALLLAS